MKRGFTLIELVMVIVILGVLAATALPRFLDLSGRAKASAIKGTLGGMRASLSIYYASAAVAGNAIYPLTLDTTLFADQKVPVDPIKSLATVVVIAGGTPEVDDAGGWIYDNVNGRVWINSTAADPATAANYSTF